MSKVRVHELAKELGYTSKEVLAKAQELGVPVLDEAGLRALLAPAHG